MAVFGRNPPGASAVTRDTPWIDHARIDKLCVVSSGIGDLIGLLILLSKRRERPESCARHNEGKRSPSRKERVEKTAFHHRYFILIVLNCDLFRVPRRQLCVVQLTSRY